MDEYEAEERFGWCGGALKNWLIGPEKVIKIRLVTDGRGLDGRGRDRRGVPDELLQ